MTAADLLARLQELGVEVRVEAGGLRARPARAVPEALRLELLAQRGELLDLVSRTCPGCGTLDYLPLGGGWRRCWACGTRYGQGRDPGDPPDLEHIADDLGVAAAPSSSSRAAQRADGWSVGVVLACPQCRNRAYSTPPAGRPHRRCDGTRGCGNTWNPEEG